MNASRLGFTAHGVYQLKKPTLLQSAKQKLSFTIASMSLFAFVIGNMVGQHGWYSFWKTVLGKEEDTMIAFVGTVPPIDKIPNYSEWAKYGGNKQSHTFAQAPQSVLHPLPPYDQQSLTNGTASAFAMQAYSTLWKGGYNSPNGSHAGVDIDAPRGTPIQSIANGIVERVSMGSVGFGHYIMIRHPNVPDVGSAGGITMLRSTYAHMDEVLVREGEVVHKGQNIGTVGNTGLVFGATGYHLYFEIDKQDAPFHPYWPFTSTEASEAGLTYVQAVNSPMFQQRLNQYTLNPMAFVQQYVSYVPKTVVANVATVSLNSVPSAQRTPTKRTRLTAADRLRARIARIGMTQTVAVVAETKPVSLPLVSSSVTEVIKTASVAEHDVAPIVSNTTNTDVDHLSFEHSGLLSRTWQKVKIMTVDTQGDLVRSPSFLGRLYIISDFGEAEIRPSELSPLDFVSGVATVNILTRNQTKPVFIVTKGAFETRSAPLVPTR